MSNQNCGCDTPTQSVFDVPFTTLQVLIKEAANDTIDCFGDSTILSIAVNTCLAQGDDAPIVSKVKLSEVVEADALEGLRALFGKVVWDFPTDPAQSGEKKDKVTAFIDGRMTQKNGQLFVAVSKLYNIQVSEVIAP